MRGRGVCGEDSMTEFSVSVGGGLPEVLVKLVVGELELESKQLLSSCFLRSSCCSREPPRLCLLGFLSVCIVRPAILSLIKQSSLLLLGVGVHFILKRLTSF